MKKEKGIKKSYALAYICGVLASGLAFFIAVFFSVIVGAADVPEVIQYPSGLSYPAALENAVIYADDKGETIAVRPMSTENPVDMKNPEKAGTKYAAVAILDNHKSEKYPAGRVLTILYMRELSRPNAGKSDMTRYDGEHMGKIKSVNFLDENGKTGIKIEYEIVTFGRDEKGTKDLINIQSAVYENAKLTYGWLVPYKAT